MELNKNDLKVLPLAIIGAAEGAFRYYVRPAVVEWIGAIAAKLHGPERQPEPWEERFFGE